MVRRDAQGEQRLPKKIRLGHGRDTVMISRHFQRICDTPLRPEDGEGVESLRFAVVKRDCGVVAERWLLPSQDVLIAKDRLTSLVTRRRNWVSGRLE